MHNGFQPLIPTQKDVVLADESWPVLWQYLKKHPELVGKVTVTLEGETRPLVIPLSVLRLLAAALRHFAHGSAVAMLAADAEISTEQAARLLNISRPSLVKLLQSGALPFRRVGRYRRLRLRDVVFVQRKVEEERAKATRELANKIKDANHAMDVRETRDGEPASGRSLPEREN